jgi:hypothetical protein
MQRHPKLERAQGAGGHVCSPANLLFEAPVSIIRDEAIGAIARHPLGVHKALPLSALNCLPYAGPFEEQHPGSPKQVSL